MVGPRHSSYEAGEQSERAHCGGIYRGKRSGAGGAKGGGQGECAPAKHALDSEPGSRVTGAGAYTASNCRHTPEVGAVCGKAARTVLCGGRDENRVPTATTQGFSFRFGMCGYCIPHSPSPDDIECNSQDRRCNARSAAVRAPV